MEETRVLRVLQHVADLDALFQGHSQITVEPLFPLQTGAFEPLLVIEDGKYQAPENDTGHTRSSKVGFANIPHGKLISSSLYTVTAADLPYVCGHVVTKQSKDLAGLLTDFAAAAVTLKELLEELEDNPTFAPAPKLYKPDHDDITLDFALSMWLEMRPLVATYMINYSLTLELPPFVDSNVIDVDPLVKEYYAGTLLTPDVLMENMFVAWGRLLRHHYMTELNWVELDALWSTMSLKRIHPQACESFYKPMFCAHIKMGRVGKRTLCIELFKGMELMRLENSWEFGKNGLPVDAREMDTALEYMEIANPIFLHGVQMAKKIKVLQEQLSTLIFHTRYFAMLIQMLLATCKKLSFNFGATHQGGQVMSKPDACPEMLLDALRKIFKTSMLLDEAHCTGKTASHVPDLLKTLPFLDLPFVQYSDDVNAYGKLNLEAGIKTVVMYFYRSDNVAFRQLFDYMAPSNIAAPPDLHKSTIRLMGTFSNFNSHQFTEYGDYKGITVNDEEYAKYMSTEIIKDTKCTMRYRVKVNFQGHGALGQACAYKTVVITSMCTAITQSFVTASLSTMEFEVSSKIYPNINRMSGILHECFSNIKNNSMFIKVQLRKDLDAAKPLNSFTDFCMGPSNVKGHPVVNFKHRSVNFLQRAEKYTFCNQIPKLKGSPFFKRIVEENCMRKQLTDLYNHMTCGGKSADVLLPHYSTPHGAEIVPGTIVGDAWFVNARCSMLAELKNFKITAISNSICHQFSSNNKYGLHYEVRLEPNSVMYRENFTDWNGYEEDVEVDAHTIDRFVESVVEIGLPVQMSAVNAQGFDREQHDRCLELLNQNDIAVVEDVAASYVNSLSVEEATENATQNAAQKRSMGDAFPKPASFNKKKKLCEAEETDFFA
ncbi:ORF84 [Ranid herpesvirus 2]|uniref:ORF84 n=1 Tax=Ranid herpesvirus 2 TaxID=389214 RepID=Q14W22_9VIRU|nr:ORF84 [Ranid herpesvirus 2]ABG25587.1 ORF84 [Ranid herpesvirus 2]